MLSPYSALSLVRQRIHALRQSTELVVCSHIPTWFLGDDFMFISVFSVELVLLRIHALRQPTELLLKLTYFLLFTRPLCATTGAMVMGCRKLWSLRSWCCPSLSLLTADSAAVMFL